MQVIYFLFAREKFQCLFELISVSFYLRNLCLCEFLYRMLNENDVNIFETMETRHFNTSNYIKSVVGEIHLLNLINELLQFLSISLIFDINIHGRLCSPISSEVITCNCFFQVWKNLFIVLKIRSQAKVTCIFVNCDENKKIFACCFPLRLFSRSLLSEVQS